MALPKITVYMHTISACSIGDLEVSKLEIHMYVCSFVRTILRTLSATVSHAVSMHVYMNCNVFELLQGRGGGERWDEVWESTVVELGRFSCFRVGKL